MRFNRKLYKEAYKAGYKKAKLNERILPGEEMPILRVPNNVLKKIQSVAFNYTIYEILFSILNEKLGYQKMASVSKLLDRDLKEDIATLVSLVHKYKVVKNETLLRKKCTKFFIDAVHNTAALSDYWTSEWGVTSDDILWMLENNYDTIENKLINIIL